MKKLSALFLVLIIALSGCGASSSKSLTAEGLLRAFKDAGLPVTDEIIYTSTTDPNEKLGRPGEYIAKINFSDAEFESLSDTPDITIEVFDKKGDMEKRRDYIQGIVDSVGANALKYYIYDNGVFLFRIPYSVTPDVAAMYKTVFNDYMAGKDITPVDREWSAPDSAVSEPSEESELTAADDSVPTEDAGTVADASQTPAWESYYDYAEYAKFNFPASENGLGDALVWTEGTAESEEVMNEKYIYKLNDSNGDKWLLVTPGDSEQLPLNQPVKIYGVFMGQSSVMDDLPTIMLTRFVSDGAVTSFSIDYEGLPIDFHTTVEGDSVHAAATINSLIRQELSAGEKITAVTIESGMLTVTVDLSGVENPPESYEVLAESGAQTITDKILASPIFDELWETITIDFGDIGSVSLQKSDAVSSDSGRHFEVSADSFQQ